MLDINACWAQRRADSENSSITLIVRDESGNLLPCRIHLTDSGGMAVRTDHLPYWHDHFACDGKASINVAPGTYRYEIERGPEFSRKVGRIDIDGTSIVNATLSRIANLRKAGWYSADLHVHRRVVDIQALMLAEDLDFAPVITWWNTRRQTTREGPTVFRFDGHRLYTNMAGEDEREGGALLYFGLTRPLDLSVLSREFPSPMQFVRQARMQNSDVWIDIEKPFWWDVPVWLASGEMNSIGLANNHMCRDQMLANEAWGKPRDTERFPGPRGNGFWTQHIYYQILNTGIRMPPTAGSASGVLPNPVGYNRVYAYLGVAPSHFTRDAWFAAIRQGQCFVTNGPLLQVRANDQLPGSELRLNDTRLSVELSIQLTSTDRVPRIEVIHNGQIKKVIPCSDAVEQRHTVPLKIAEPGWFLVRAITAVQSTFRFASTAPWYVEADKDIDWQTPEADRFFLDWVNQRIQRVHNHVTDRDQLDAVLQPHRQAHRFWSQRLERHR